MGMLRCLPALLLVCAHALSMSILPRNHVAVKSELVTATACDDRELYASRGKQYPVFARKWHAVNDIIGQLKHKLCSNSSRPTASISISFLNVRMSDGVELATIVIDPTTPGQKRAAVLCRSPYGPTSQNMAEIFTITNGHVAVLQDDRGTYASQGRFDMWRNSKQDGVDTLKWISQQPWSNGDVYTVGASADGISTATLIFAEPAAVKAQWFMWTTMEGHSFIYPQGAYRMDILEGYMNGIEALIHGAGAGVIKEVRANERWSEWWYNLTACRDRTTPVLPQCHFQQVDWPVVMTAGWWDIFQMTQLDAWAGLRLDGAKRFRDSHVLMIGPLGHCSLDQHRLELFAAESVSILTSVSLSSEFFGGDTAGRTRGSLGRVNYFVMKGYDGGKKGNFWASADDWPPPSSPMIMYLAEHGFAPTPPTENGSVAFVYDPSNPTPMAGGTNLPGAGDIKICGTADQSARQARPDVLTFDSAPLDDDTAVVGSIFSRFFFGSSAPDTDFFITLDDVRPSSLLHKETSYLVRYGAVRMRWRGSSLAGQLFETPAPPMKPGQVYEAAIDMGNTAYIFPKGHRIRVSVSSAAYPYLDANSNTGRFELVDNVPPIVARNQVFFGGETASQISLPIVKIDELAKNEYLGAAMAEAMARQTLRN